MSEPFEYYDGAQAVLRAKRITIQDDDGQDVARFGRLPDGTYGLELIADTGQEVYRFTNSTGQYLPAHAVPFVQTRDVAAAGVAVTSPTFLDVFNRSMDVVTADALDVIVPWTTGVGTTGEIRLSNNIAGGAVSDAITLAANTSGFAHFKWLHGQPLGAGPFEPAIQVKRTGGTNSVTVWPPGLATVIVGARIGATSGGT